MYRSVRKTGVIHLPTRGFKSRRILFLVAHAPILLVTSTLTSRPLFAQDNVASPSAPFQSAVIKLVKHKIAGPLVLTKYATAWCLTPTCDYVVTNYHVAALFGNPIKYEGTKTVKKGVFLGTGERDYGARRIPLEFGGWQRYNPVRDVAILKFERPIPEHAPPRFSLANSRRTRRSSPSLFRKAVIFGNKKARI